MFSRFDRILVFHKHAETDTDRQRHAMLVVDGR